MEEHKDHATGWASEWRLLSTPLTRRLDVWVKTISVGESTIMIAYSALLLNVVVAEAHWFAALLVPTLLALTFAVGPPRRPAWMGVLRVVVASVLRSPELAGIGAVWMCFEFGDEFLMPRLLAAGRGGTMPSMRATRRSRVKGLAEVRASYQKRLLRTLGLPAGSQEHHR